ncbi:MAG: TIGR03936 family radical SAM-associated protein [Lachnospiraceae bacterium]|nr:TIGR03936 family radical SAM-associated protein [Lachnospiraceae bacterium]
MKIRIKFTKTGPVKYVGHLDMLRYFQKLIRRGEIDICYSSGFNPHQKMSFAAPLGVGMAGEGEYVDIEVYTATSSEQAVEVLNGASVEGIEIKSFKRLPDSTLNAMSSVAAADYFVKYRDGYEPDFSLCEEFERFMSEKVIEIEKETKKSTAVLDIKPLIYEYKYGCDKDFLSLSENKNGIFFKLATGSVNNLKPSLVLLAFYQFLKKDMPEFAFDITRIEVYGTKEDEEKTRFVPLDDFGENIV